MKHLAWVSILFAAGMLVPARAEVPQPTNLVEPDSLATVFIYNTNPAKQCYKSAQAGAELAFGLEHCNIAMRDPLMGYRAQTLVNRGIIRYDLGDKRGALADLARAISLNPALGDAYLNQALVLVSDNHPQQAMDAISKGIALGASNLQLAYYTRGEIEDDAGHFAEAYRDYKEALVIRPDFEPAIRQLERFKLVPQGGTIQ